MIFPKKVKVNEFSAIRRWQSGEIVITMPGGLLKNSVWQLEQLFLCQ